MISTFVYQISSTVFLINYSWLTVIRVIVLDMILCESLARLYARVDLANDLTPR